MRLTRVLLPLFALLLALVAETVWLAPLGLPGVVPPLSLVVLFAVTRWLSAPNAALIGFALGCFLDLMPPSDAPLGVSAFAFALTAFGLSQWRSLIEGSTLLTLFGWSLATALAQLMRLTLLIAAGVQVGGIQSASFGLLMSPLYGLMIASLVLPLSALLDRVVAAPRAPTIFR